MSWTQPVCEDCWNKDNPGRPARKFNEGPIEICCKCGISNKSGIFIRIDPTTVPHPKVDD